MRELMGRAENDPSRSLNNGIPQRADNNALMSIKKG
jgi:hypothetical protein